MDICQGSMFAYVALTILTHKLSSSFKYWKIHIACKANLVKWISWIHNAPSRLRSRNNLLWNQMKATRVITLVQWKYLIIRLILLRIESDIQVMTRECKGITVGTELTRKILLAYDKWDPCQELSCILMERKPLDVCWEVYPIGSELHLRSMYKIIHITKKWFN